MARHTSGSPAAPLLLALFVSAAGCSSPTRTVDGPTAPQTSPPSPNQTTVVARVISVREIRASTLGIEPEQTLCELVLDVTSSDPPGIFGLNGEQKDPGVSVYAREMRCDSGLRNQVVSLALTFRGDGSNGHWWVVRDLTAR